MGEGGGVGWVSLGLLNKAASMKFEINSTVVLYHECRFVSIRTRNFIGFSVVHEARLSVDS